MADEIKKCFLIGELVRIDCTVCGIEAADREFASHICHGQGKKADSQRESR